MEAIDEADTQSEVTMIAHNRSSNRNSNKVTSYDARAFAELMMKGNEKRLSQIDESNDRDSANESGNFG